MLVFGQTSEFYAYNSFKMHELMWEKSGIKKKKYDYEQNTLLTRMLASRILCIYSKKSSANQDFGLS